MASQANAMGVTARDVTPNQAQYVRQRARCASIWYMALFSDPCHSRSAWSCAFKRDGRTHHMPLSAPVKFGCTTPSRSRMAGIDGFAVSTLMYHILAQRALYHTQLFIPPASITAVSAIACIRAVSERRGHVCWFSQYHRANSRGSRAPTSIA